MALDQISAPIAAAAWADGDRVLRVKHLVVPVDLSQHSLAAVPVAARMAAQSGGRVDVLTVVSRLADVEPAGDELRERLAAMAPLPATVRQVVSANPSVVDAILRHLERNSDTTVTMSSRGHGRSAAIVGSTTNQLLRASHRPVIVIGPNATKSSGELSGRYVVPLDGSPRGDEVLPVVAAVAGQLGGAPWLIEVITSGAEFDSATELVPSSFVSRRASELSRTLGYPVDFEVLHGGNAATSIVDFARSEGASLIFMTTHGRTGLARLTAGSIAADVIRRATAPVVLMRPARLTA